MSPADFGRLLARLSGEGGGARCQFVSPSPWGPTQCGLPADHEPPHAFRAPIQLAGNEDEQAVVDAFFANHPGLDDRWKARTDE